jgi:hypothetical protein
MSSVEKVHNGNVHVVTLLKRKPLILKKHKLTFWLQKNKQS